MSDEIKDKDGIEGQNPDNLQDSQNNDPALALAISSACAKLYEP